MSTVKYTLSASRIQDYLDCNFRYALAKVHKIVPAEEKDIFRIGTNWQEIMELITMVDVPDGANQYELLLDLITEKINTAYATPPSHTSVEEWATERNILYYAAAAYLTRLDPNIRKVDAELKFRLKIIDPREKSKAYADDAIIMGAVDDLCRDQQGFYIGENKSTSSDISAGSDYWNEKHTSLQPKTYIYCLQRMQVDGDLLKYGVKPTDPLINRVVYNAWKKPNIKPKGLTQVQTAHMLETGTYAAFPKEGDPIEYGKFVISDKGDPIVYVDDELASIEIGKRGNALHETPGMYGVRLYHEIMDRPDSYFAQHTVTYTKRDMGEFEKELYSIYRKISHSTEFDLFPKNRKMCRPRGSFKCDYVGICDTEQDINGIVPVGFKCYKDR